MQPRNCTSTLTQSKARAVSSESHFAAIRSKRGKKPCPSREERPAYPCTLRSVWLKRHSVLLGLPPPPPLIAAGPCRLPQAGNRAQDLAQGIVRCAHALHASPESVAEIHGVRSAVPSPLALHLPPGCGCPPARLPLDRSCCSVTDLCSGAGSTRRNWDPWGCNRKEQNFRGSRLQNVALCIPVPDSCHVWKTVIQRPPGEAARLSQKFFAQTNLHSHL